MDIYIKKFISATTPFTLVPLFLLANNTPNRKYNIMSYMLTAPFYLGLLNVVVYYLFRKSNLVHHYLITYIISLIMSFIIVSTFDSYDYNKKQWINYYLKMIIGHFIFWFLGVRFVESTFMNHNFVQSY